MSVFGDDVPVLEFEPERGYRGGKPRTNVDVS